MAVHKKTVIEKSKKKIVKKHINHKALGKKSEEEKKSQASEVQHDASVPQQAPISESVGGPVVILSGVLQDTPKEKSQSEPELPKVETQQAEDTLVSQPESTTNNIPSVEPIATQDPFTVDGVVRDKPEQEHIEGSKKKWSWVIIGFITVVIIFIAGVLWYFRENAVKQISQEDEITSTPSPSRVSPTPASDSAKLAIDYSKYKIKVLNGSGIGGAAAKGKEIIEGEKFIVEEIGNAETSDFDLTVIQAKKGVDKAFLDKLKSVLGETYLLDANKELEDSEEVDVVIIIGSSKQP